MKFEKREAGFSLLKTASLFCYQFTPTVITNYPAPALAAQFCQTHSAEP
jgi:hypothetical protein